MISLSEFGEFLKQTSKTWLGLFIASGVLWFLPQFVFGGDSPDKNYPYFSVAIRCLFVLSASMIASDVAFTVRDYVRDRMAKNSKFEALKRLTPPERDLLRRYLEAETKSLGLDSKDATVVLFVRKKWISQPVNYVGVTIGEGQPFLPPHVLEDWIYDYLKDHKELIS